MTTWLYWEGPCPQWVERCQQTIFRHAPNVQLLNPVDFDLLHEEDRDIDLSPLHAPHRADFVRAYLLARFGGMWLDSDCLLMKSPTEALEAVNHCEYVGYRENTGAVSNGLMIVPPGSRVARRYYESLCGILRSKQSIGWLTLGANALTPIVNDSENWTCLPKRQIMPVDWSEQAEFFRRGDVASHEAKWDRNAICYMMSASMLHRVPQPEESLLKSDTFFSFLVSRSLETIK